MKTVLVMGDTHGHKGNIELAVRRFADADMIIHLGDYSRDADLVRALTDKPVYAVSGNCDLSSSAEDELILSIEDVRLLAVHGHKQHVKTSLLNLGLYAQEKEVQIALFGHTHLPKETHYQNVRLFNPGSLGEPRGARPSVGLLTFDKGTFRTKLLRL